MLPQLEQDLLHLERRRQRLNQYGPTYSPVRHADIRLREAKDVVPQPCLLVVLHLGKVEVRSGATLDELDGVVEEIETEVKEGARHGSVVDGDAGFVEMPSSRPELVVW